MRGEGSEFPLHSMLLLACAFDAPCFGLGGALIRTGHSPIVVTTWSLLFIRFYAPEPSIGLRSSFVGGFPDQKA